jgi:hypothetical protein
VKSDKVKSCYLDTNAIRYLFRLSDWSPQQLADVRRRLLHGSRTGRVVVLGSLAIFEELASLAEHGRRYRSRAAYAWNLLGKRVLADPRELLQREIRLRRPLRGSERFITPTLRRNLAEALKDRALMQNVSRDVRQWAHQLYKERPQVREKARARIKAALTPRETVQGAYRRWFREHPSEVDDWARDFMRAQRETLGLGHDEADWPNPRSIPSLWSFFAFATARIYLVDGEGRAIKRGDPQDIFHYTAAAYADVLVTDDGPMRETCGLIPTTRFELQWFEEFVRDTLGVRKW